MRWRATNLWLYRAAHRLHRWRRWRGAAPRTAAAAVASGPLLYLANGRLGDALVAAAFTRRYREWFGGVVAVGRPETEAVVAPLVDRFISFHPGAGRAAARAAAAAVAAAGCARVLGDLHVFHGGDELLALAAAVPSRPVLYDGWIDRGRQAPFRRWPAGAVVVPALEKGDAVADPERLHVWHDLQHYHRHALRHLGIDAALPDRPWLPETALDGSAAAAFGLPANHVACHASSSQGKKDWPLLHFHRVFAACPDRTFAVLGGDADATLPPLPNVRDLRGRTTVRQALAVAASGEAFLGLDSGLAHAAALAAVPTVVVMSSAIPGFFFPYPRAFGGHVRSVQSPRYRACAGCGGICVHEPIWQSRKRGFPCLRAVEVDDVVAALRAALQLRTLRPGDAAPAQ